MDSLRHAISPTLCCETPYNLRNKPSENLDHEFDLTVDPNSHSRKTNAPPQTHHHNSRPSHSSLLTLYIPLIIIIIITAPSFSLPPFLCFLEKKDSTASLENRPARTTDIKQLHPRLRGPLLTLEEDGFRLVTFRTELI